jgi:hypothetical protein
VADIVLIRADDHLVVGVRWAGFTITGSGDSSLLTAGAAAYLMVLLPPQHVGEEASLPASAAPPPAQSDGAGGHGGRVARRVVSPDAATFQDPAGHADFADSSRAARRGHVAMAGRAGFNSAGNSSGKQSSVTAEDRRSDASALPSSCAERRSLSAASVRTVFT